MISRKDTKRRVELLMQWAIIWPPTVLKQTTIPTPKNVNINLKPGKKKQNLLEFRGAIPWISWINHELICSFLYEWYNLNSSKRKRIPWSDVWRNLCVVEKNKRGWETYHGVRGDCLWGNLEIPWSHFFSSQSEYMMIPVPHKSIIRLTILIELRKQHLAHFVISGIESTCVEQLS